MTSRTCLHATCLACDASPFGVGAVLSHLVDRVERPVAYASRTLNNAHTVIFGPKKGTPSLAAARLQRWALISMAHQYDIIYQQIMQMQMCCLDSQ